eukprot:1545536-Prymnesium_polylepis.2
MRRGNRTFCESLKAASIVLGSTRAEDTRSCNKASGQRRGSGGAGRHRMCACGGRHEGRVVDTGVAGQGNRQKRLGRA